MPSLVLLDWNRYQIRVALAEGRGETLSIRKEHTLELGGTDDETDLSLGGQLGDILSQWRTGKCEAVACLARSLAEVRLLRIPPTPTDELPLLVRLQAVQHFAALDDGAPFDFVPILEDGDTRQVVAATTEAETVTRIQRTVAAAGLTLKGIVLRPSAAVSLVRRTPAYRAGHLQLLVDQLNGETEISVFDDDSLFLTRVARLPIRDESSRCRDLVNEIRRTVAAARTQLGGRAIDHVVVTSQCDRALTDRLTDELGFSVAFCDPASSADFGPDAAPGDSNAAQSLTSVVGVALDEVQDRQTGIDFLRPRRTPEPPDHRRTWSIAAAVAAGILLLIGATIMWRLHSLDREVADLRDKNRRLDGLVTEIQKEQLYLDSITAWHEACPNWLVELSELSQRVPAADKLRLERLQVDLAGGGGSMLLKGFVDASATASELETSLRDEYHVVEGLDRDFVGDDAKYPWYFSKRIIVSPTRDDPADTPDTADGGESP